MEDQIEYEKITCLECNTEITAMDYGMKICKCGNVHATVTPTYMSAFMGNYNHVKHEIVTVDLINGNTRVRDVKSDENK